MLLYTFNHIFYQRYFSRQAVVSNLAENWFIKFEIGDFFDQKYKELPISDLSNIYYISESRMLANPEN